MFCCFCVLQKPKVSVKYFFGGSKMKMKTFFNVVVSTIMVLALCGAAQAVTPDSIVLVTATGTFTINEFDLNGTGQTSFWATPAGVDVYCSAGNSNGAIVWGLSDGSARVARYDSLDTTVSSGVVGNGSGILGAAIRPNGNLYFGSLDGWVYARSGTNVTAAPVGYTQPANLQLGSAGGMYMYPTSGAVDEVLIAGNDIGSAFLRQGNNMSATVGSSDGMQFGSSITGTLVLSTGDVVIASRAGNPDGYIFVRDNADLSLAPAGYVDHAILGNGSRTVGTAMATKVVNGIDYLVIGNDSGELFVRAASDVSNGDIAGFASTYSAYMAQWTGIRALTITSNNNVVIVGWDGRMLVRSLFDIDGADVTALTTRYTMSGVCQGVYAIPEPMTITLLAGGLFGLLRRRR